MPGETQPCCGPVPLASSPGGSQVVSGLSLVLTCQRARRLARRRVLGLMWEMRSERTEGSCSCGQAPPDFLGRTVRQVRWRPHCRERAAWRRAQVGQELGCSRGARCPDPGGTLSGMPSDVGPGGTVGSEQVETAQGVFQVQGWGAKVRGRKTGRASLAGSWQCWAPVGKSRGGGASGPLGPGVGCGISGRGLLPISLGPGQVGAEASGGAVAAAWVSGAQDDR